VARLIVSREESDRYRHQVHRPLEIIKIGIQIRPIVISRGKNVLYNI
jgi:hypothetical protein